MPVQIALSGGIDSSLLLAYASSSSYLKNKISQAITISFDGFKKEADKASSLADSLEIPHIVENISFDQFLDELITSVKATSAPMEHPHSISYRVLTAKARESGKVLLTGEGADEIFMGYSHYTSNSVNSFAFRKYIKLHDYFTGSLHNQYKTAFDSLEPLRKKSLKSKKDSRDLEIKTHLLSLLRRNDKMSMANSVEIRSPFLDFNLCHTIENHFNSDFSGLSKDILLQELLRMKPCYKKDPIKIGFYTPFDRWYEVMKDSKEVSNLIGTALEYIGDYFNLRIHDNETIDARLAWILINVGCFMEYN